MTCTGMCLSGSRIATGPATTARRRMVLAFCSQIALSAPCAAVLGTTFRTLSARPTAEVTVRPPATQSSAQELRERYGLLDLYVTSSAWG